MWRARLFDEDARQAMYGADEGFSRRRSPPAALEGQGSAGPGFLRMRREAEIHALMRRIRTSADPLSVDNPGRV
jgi:hypothetical protein